MAITNNSVNRIITFLNNVNIFIFNTYIMNFKIDSCDFSHKDKNFYEYANYNITCN